MTIKTNLIPEFALERMTALAFWDRLDFAVKELIQTGLTDGQKLKIADILCGPLPEYNLAGIEALKERIIAVVTSSELTPLEGRGYAASGSSGLNNDGSENRIATDQKKRNRLDNDAGENGADRGGKRARTEPLSTENKILENEMSEDSPIGQSSSAAMTDIISSEQGKCIYFSDFPTSPFAMGHPCVFEFKGKNYSNATACFLAQQYTDQPDVMNLFTMLDPEEASALAEITPMTKKRKLTWENPYVRLVNKDDVLMYVQRAKFGQNPELKKELLSTGSTYLVCQGRGFYLTDNFNGTGENALGKSLMRLRGEYGGIALVAKPSSYLSTANSYSILHEIPEDIIGVLFKKCLSQSDWKTLTVFPCLNKRWNQFATNFGEGLDLKVICPELTILDAKAQGKKCDDEPKISKLKLLKEVKELAPHVEENAGVTKLTMTKGATLNQLIKIAKEAGIRTIDIPSNDILEELGDVPVEQTYAILITNNVFVDSRNKAFNLQETLVEGHGCKMPTVQEYVALCVFTNKIFKKCVYGRNPLTFGRSSMRIHNMNLLVGGSSLSRLSFVITNFEDKDEICGAGGQRKF